MNLTDVFIDCTNVLTCHIVRIIDIRKQIVICALYGRKSVSGTKLIITTPKGQYYTQQQLYIFTGESNLLFFQVWPDNHTAVGLIVPDF